MSLLSHTQSSRLGPSKRPSWQLGPLPCPPSLWIQHLQFIPLGTPLMFLSLLGGTPKPEPEQVIKKYTEELKMASDEVCVTGATLPLVLFGGKGWLLR